MSLLERMRAEIERRSGMLPAEVQRWKALADQDAAPDPNKNVGKMGIHRSQLDALKLMMDGLQERQTELLKDLKADLAIREFATGYVNLSDEIVAAHELWRIFRYIISLHKDITLGPLVDAADLIASDCYLTCMNKARDWNLIKEDEFRAPPLVYLEADLSPSTASRGAGASAVGFTVRRYRNMRLPIPLILLPSDNATSMWMMATLHHEVGHNLDQDLGLQKELNNILLTRLEKAGVPAERQQMWWQWLSEILADTFGILLGNTGFAYALCWWLLVMAPEARFQELNAADVHPPFYIRIHLVAKMLRGFKIAELDTAADSLIATANAQQRPAWVDPYLDDCETVADILLNEPLKKLGPRTIKELGPDVANDVKRVAALEQYFRTGIGSPGAELPASAKWRHVPLAAQMAFASQQNPDLATLDQIQNLSLNYLSAIPRPKFMGPQPDKSDHFRSLMRDLKLS